MGKVLSGHHVYLELGSAAREGTIILIRMQRGRTHFMIHIMLISV